MEKIMKFIKKLLYNLKWIGVAFSIIYGLSFIEKATDEYGISRGEEYVMYTFGALLIITILLFFFEQKWIEICNKILKYINNNFQK